MNEWKPIIQRHRDSIVPISLSHNGREISYGTGTLCNQKGSVITACHVVDQVTEIKNDSDNNTEILVKIKSNEIIKYKPLLLGVHVHFKILGPILLDIAIIVPEHGIKTEHFSPPLLEHFPLDCGEGMLLAGYSEEIPFALNIDRLLKKKMTVDQAIEFDMQIGFGKEPAFKSGILSYKEDIHIEGSKTIDTAIFHVDNGMHAGASGGPMINSAGEFVGIITHRATICHNVLVEKNSIRTYLPSGNTFGISTSALNPFKHLL